MLHTCRQTLRWPLEVMVAACEMLESIGMVTLSPAPPLPGTSAPQVEYEWVQLSPEHHAALQPPPPPGPAGSAEALRPAPPCVAAAAQPQAASRPVRFATPLRQAPAEGAALVVDLTADFAYDEDADATSNENAAQGAARGRARQTKYGRCRLCERALRLRVLMSNAMLVTFSRFQQATLYESSCASRARPCQQLVDLVDI